MYRYFISAYIKVSEDTGENGYTNFIYDSDFKLNTMERINEIKKDILKVTNYSDLIILYFTEIEKTDNESIMCDKTDNDRNEVETEEIPPDTSGMDMSNVSVDDDTEVADCEAEETEETDNANNTEDVVEDSTSTTTETE